MANNSKTPVMILQELMVKLKYTPEFNLTRQSGGTHEPIFEYMVTAKHVTATGHGRSKKDAKHDAARNALKKLADMKIYVPDSKDFKHQQDYSPPDSPDLTEMVQMNYVGHLKEFCIEKRLPDPIFEIISDIGPPHARQFTMQCAVGTVKCIKTSTTKKSAKQITAKQMLQLLMDTVDCGGIVVPLEDMECRFDQEAMEKHDELKPPVVTNLSRKIVDYHKALKEELDKPLQVNGLILLDQPMDDVVTHLEAVLKELDINSSIDELPSKENYVGVSVRLQTDPPFEIAAYKKTYECAKLTAAERTLQFLKIMLT